MYESSCSYQAVSNTDVKRIKSEEAITNTADCWPAYRFATSTFEQLKQSVEKAKQALADSRTNSSTTTSFGAFTDLYPAAFQDPLVGSPTTVRNHKIHDIDVKRNHHSGMFFYFLCLFDHFNSSEANW